MHICVHTWRPDWGVCVCVRSPELELQAVVSCPMWLLGREFESSGRAASVLND